MKPYSGNSIRLSFILFDKIDRKHFKNKKSRKKRGSIYMERSYKKSFRQKNKQFNLEKLE